MHLPDPIDPVFFDEHYRKDVAAWRPAVIELCMAHGLGCTDVSAFSEGSNLVASVDDRCVVKIFPPFHEHQWESERLALPHLHGHLPVRLPAVLAEGTRVDGWPYLILEKLPGVLLESCWDSVEHGDKVRILEEIGATMSAAHRVPIGPLAALPPEWGTFLRRQLADCRRRHAELGAPGWLVNDLPDFVTAYAVESQATRDRVVLTGEYTPFNLLVQRDTGGWRLTGMIDLGDAMVGPPDYDLLGPSLFCCGGERELIAALFRGYYGKETRITRDFRMRLMALAVLHRYANLDFQVRIAAWRDRAGSLEELADLLWPVG